MIENNEQINEYKEHNKIYIPQEYVNENNKYTIDNDTITIITNQNCYNQYNTTYCDCIRYNIKYNLISETYSCNRNPSNFIIRNEYITSNVNDSYRITNDYKNDYIIMFGTMIIVILVIIMYKKNSRRI